MMNKKTSMILFNPVLDTSERSHGAFEEISERALELSPMHYIYEGVPPTIIFHGTGDKGVPIAKSAEFCEKMLKAGNECTLVPYEGREHGFFNPGIEDNDDCYFDTLYRMEKFIESLRSCCL